jgi:flagellar assembly factor FliW
MVYEVTGSILGFENTKQVTISEIDELFSTMHDADNQYISFTIANPYVLREYSFDVPSEIRMALEIGEKSNVSVYNIVVIQKPLEDSTVNFLAPIIINHDNNKLVQIVLDKVRHPDFGMNEKIKSFKEA